ncbi:MAG: nitroreductase family protein [Ignavibacteriales bacterium]
MINTDNQIFARPIIEVIRSRYSVRTYMDKPLTADHKLQLNQYINDLQAQSDIGVRLKLVDSDIALQETGARLGTYGVIKGASSYIVTAINNNIQNTESFGYCFEKLVLFAASIGLGTCWMASTFKRSAFEKAIELTSDEIMPIITPVGYPKNGSHTIETLFRMAARSNTRKEWNELFFDRNLTKPMTEEKAEEYAVALEMLRLAPSASNKQPWRIVKENDSFHFFLHRTRGYGDRFGYDIQRIDIGIAMCHFELTLLEQGAFGLWCHQKPNLHIDSKDMIYVGSWVRS